MWGPSVTLDIHRVKGRLRRKTQEGRFLKDEPMVGSDTKESERGGKRRGRRGGCVTGGDLCRDAIQEDRS